MNTSHIKRYLVYVLIFAFVVILGSNRNLYSQTTSGEKVKEKSSTGKPVADKSTQTSVKETTFTWYKYDEGLTKAKKEKKHVMVHFYTNWCGWCKRMDKNTFANSEVMKLLNDNYVPIKVNAESAEKVKVDGKEMTLREVATKYGVRAFPHTWFLKPNGERIGDRRGYVEAEEFKYILNWVKDDRYDEVSFNEFVKQQKEKTDSEKK
jgi:thioredoxin-related protein